MKLVRSFVFGLTLCGLMWPQEQSAPLGDVARQARTQKQQAPSAKKKLEEDASGCPDLAVPKLILTGKEQEPARGGRKGFARFLLEVTNYDAYSDSLFAPAPNLPACGLNKNSARTWVGIYGADGSEIYGFCGLTRAQDLTKLWFADVQGHPARAYITLNDRQCHKEVKSNLVAVPVR